MSELFIALAAILYLPTVWVIRLLFLYAFIELGRMLVRSLLRYRHREALSLASGLQPAPGYPVLNAFVRAGGTTVEQADLLAMRQLELVRIATRVGPMLGLIATLIPMGPALLAMTQSDLDRMAELLRDAFAAVVLALAAASIMFWVASVCRRWAAEEVIAIGRYLERARS
jgi:biopolymer transport protein ExbB/TolQ